MTEPKPSEQYHTVTPNYGIGLTEYERLLLWHKTYTDQIRSERDEARHWARKLYQENQEWRTASNQSKERINKLLQELALLKFRPD